MALSEDTRPYDPFRKERLDPGEEIVISGISGKYPESDSIQELRENLMNKVDMINADDRRWKLDHPEIPQRLGKLKDLSKFDSEYFGIHFKDAHTMDPMCRILLESIHEALIDAGVNPVDLRGTNTGVFLGICFSESEMTWIYDNFHADIKGAGLTGCSRSIMANRISYWLGVTGPSYSVDSACSSSLFAIQQAFQAVITGVCEAAIVSGGNLCLHPNVSLQFTRLGVLSPDGRSKSFDNRADGYVRSETISALYLQRAKHAKRVYATVVHAKTNCDGFKPQGITFPSSAVQALLLGDFYKECLVPPSSVGYLECHGTGTTVGDPEELHAIESIFCSTKRKEPLKIGSVKSNLGHSEASSGMCQISKVIITFEDGIIPPNLHYQTPKEGVEGLIDGRLKVITEKTPFSDDNIAISSFGFGGANAHILLKPNLKKKVNKGAPRDDLPRLVCVSGRTEEAVDSLLNDLENRPVDVEYVRLLQDIHAKKIFLHKYRGYTVLSTSGAKKRIRSIKYYPEKKRPIWFVFSGVGSEWPSMGASLLRFPVFAAAIKRCDAVLRNRGVDIYDVLTNGNKSAPDYIVNSSVGVAAVQIGLVDLLTSLRIVPDGIMGYSVGELICAYADGCLTAEQIILATYYRAIAVKECNKIRGAMAIVGLSYQDVESICPSGVQVIGHNSHKSSTISGPAETVTAFVAKLTANNIFADEIACNGIAYHSGYIAEVGPKLYAHLQKVIPTAKARSSKWYSTSVPKSHWNSPQAKLASAEYYINNLLSPVLLEETTKLIPKNAITIEIAPRGILQEILDKSLNPKTTNVALMQIGHMNNVDFFLQSIGQLYEVGLQPAIWKLYPQVQFPVSRGTPMISPLIKWNHTENWYVTSYKNYKKIKSGERLVDVALSDGDYEYMAGHVIDGKYLLPATGYLVFVWETVGMMRGELHSEVPIVFENIKFMRATTLSMESSVSIAVFINKGSGQFEVVEGDIAIVSGTVRTISNIQEEQISFPITNEDEPEPMTTKDIYKEFRLRGYQYSGYFRSLKSATTDGSKGTVLWKNNWVAFMDNMLQIQLLSKDTCNLMVPTNIRKLTINGKKHSQMVRAMPPDQQEFKVYLNKKHNVIHSGGIEIYDTQASTIARRKTAGEPVLESYQFIAHQNQEEITLKTATRIATHIAIENHLGLKVKMLEYFADGEQYPQEEFISHHISDTLADLPLMQADVNIVTPENHLTVENIPQGAALMELKKFSSETNALIIAGRNLIASHANNSVHQLLSTIKDNSFVISIETKLIEDILTVLKKYSLFIILEKLVDGSKFLLLRKVERVAKNTHVIHVSTDDLQWINSLQTLLKKEVGRQIPKSLRIILVNDKAFDNGLLGFTNCLRKELGGQVVRCVLIQDPKAPDFSLSLPLYANQLRLDLAFNVLREDATWGSYRHLLLSPPIPRPVYHAWANQLVRGDFSSFRWMEGEITPDNNDPGVVRLIYSALNFKDIMVASGKLNADIFVMNRRQAECVLGFEYVGITPQGVRIMGIVNSRAITNLLDSSSGISWVVPDSWSLVDAIGVPSVYGTCISAFYIHGKMKKGDKVLIHSGSGGVGQAAINLALFTGCEVFTTVGTMEKRLFIRKIFPQISDDHIGNSRDTSFEQMIMNITNGRGVDIVLNSLADDKLQASFRCLAEGGRFLEIGKADMANNSTIGMAGFKKGISFHGILLDRLLVATEEKRNHFQMEMQRIINAGAVKPLNVTVYPKEQIEQAFRFMAAGKHVGKVVLKIQDEDRLGEPILAYPRYYCLKNRSYIILGGLGGFGLELADWLVLRGAQYIILTSRSGIKNGYQMRRVKIWQNYGVKITIVTGKEASNPKDCEEILSIAAEQAPVDAIFNLAVVLKDNFFENQTAETFQVSFNAKAWATKNLDLLSRKMCPQLRHFVVFSSVSCGRGNAGQTNYGMSNSVMERICERRAAEGLPALAIQWGAVGDVGLVADMQDNDKELVIGGTLQQRITSCLHELDRFLKQKLPIVASMVVAEKRAGGSSSLDVVETILNIMGLKDLKSVSQHTALAELGMDSMMGVEIKQTLEREFDIFLTAQDIRALNFAKLKEMNTNTMDDTMVAKVLAQENKGISLMDLLLKVLGDDETYGQELFVQLPTKAEKGREEIFLIPGIEGFSSVFKIISPIIKSPATCLQLDNNDTRYLTIGDMAKTSLSFILSKYPNRKEFLIVGYSFGSVVAIELVRQLESENRKCKLILIDGSVDFLRYIKNVQLRSERDEELATNVLVGITNKITSGIREELYVELNKCMSWEEKLNIYMERFPPNILKMSRETLRNMTICIYYRLLALGHYDTFKIPPIKSDITLLKPTIQSFKDLAIDYGLSKITTGKINIITLEGDHVTILDNPKVAAVINGDLTEESTV